MSLSKFFIKSIEKPIRTIKENSDSQETKDLADEMLNDACVHSCNQCYGNGLFFTYFGTDSDGTPEAEYCICDLGADLIKKVHSDEETDTKWRENKWWNEMEKHGRVRDL